MCLNIPPRLPNLLKLEVGDRVKVEGRRANQKPVMTATFIKKWVEDGCESLGKVKVVLCSVPIFDY